MGKMFFLLASLLACGAGIALYASDADGTHWVVRALAAFLMVIAIGLTEAAQHMGRDTFFSRLGAIYAFIFLGMAAYSLHLNLAM